MPYHPLKNLLTNLTIILLPLLTSSYTTQLTINTTSSKTVTYFNTDLGSCACDISTACDTFCCCDNKCSIGLTTNWTNSGWCADSAVEIEKNCTKIGTKGFATFQDLACVMYSNRGEIGQYYATPNINNLVDPNIEKFSTKNVRAQAVNQYTQPITNTYQQNSPIKLKINNGASDVVKSLITWIPSMGQACRQNYVPITEGVSTSNCVYSVPDAEACLNLNAEFVGSNFLFCEYRNCSTTIIPTSSTSSVGASTYSSGTCSGAVTGVDLTLTISYASGQYRIVTASLVFTTSTFTTKKVAVTTKISITKVGIQSSGNPGYLLGKTLKYSTGGIYQIANSADKSCITAASANTNALDIRFGVNQTFFCLTTTPCQTPLYIDRIPLGTSYRLLKYASKSTQDIVVSGLGTTSCNTQQFTIFILYSYSGWILDPQYYILGSKIVAQTSSNQSNKMKKLNVKWVRVQPDLVVTPPTNYFYTYFSKLWDPLKSSYYRYTGNA